jgi:hypothetical protein
LVIARDNGVVFTGSIRRRFLAINPHPTTDFQVVDNAANEFGLGSRLHVEYQPVRPPT